MLNEARGGGSISSEYRDLLGGLEKEGRVEVREGTEAIGATWDDRSRTWNLRTNTSLSLERVDHVVYATGISSDFHSIPLIQELINRGEIETVGGMPVLTDDLQMSVEVPFFVTGRLAGLRLGIGAANLEGARMGVERIAWKVRELLREKGWGENEVDVGEEGDIGYGSENGREEKGGVEVDMRRLGLGMENQFEVLELSDDEGSVHDVWVVMSKYVLDIVF
jgi:hypothetical protein